MRLILALAILAGSTTAAAQVQTPPAPAVARAATALAELDRAAAALGLPNAASASSIGWDVEGTLYSPNQGPVPSKPSEQRLVHRQYGDFNSGATYVALDFSGPESSFQRSTVLRHDSAGADLLELTAMSLPSVLRHLAAQPADLRVLSRGPTRTVIAGPLLDRLVELELGPDGLPLAVSHVFGDDLFGDAVRRVEYSDYRTRDGRNLPGRVRQIEAGRIVFDARLEGFTINGQRPEWSAAIQPRPAHPPTETSGFAVERIAPGIHYVKQYGGSDYNGLAVELADAWMVLETPRALRDGTALREALASISQKPIAYAAATHHHSDHSAGMTAFAHDPVTVLTTPGNVDFFRTMVEAPRDFDRTAARARVLGLSQGQRVGPVQFLDAGPTAHVQEILLFYFPEQRILFHSDMGRFNDDGSVEPARPQTCTLLSFIERSGLAVDKIYAGHGSPGTMDDLKRAIAMRQTPCPGPAA